MFVHVLGDYVDVFRAHGYDNLFSRWSLSGYVNLGPCFLMVVLCNIVHFDNFSFDNFGKASLILRISVVLPLVACAKDLVFLWYLDLARVLVLGLGRIGEEVLKMLASLFLVWLAIVMGVPLLLKLDATDYQSVLEFLSAKSLFQLEL